ncbi:MAG: GSCFA domain-containing protein [Sediminibacterium sp.]|nr:GSCFA domain-containing protein [Sediminibacterium sp.]
MFHLDYKPQKASWNISHADTIFTIGSCFAQNMGERLQQLKFNSTVNPHGILFNPISIAYSLENILASAVPEQDMFAEHGGIWFSHYYHSDIYAQTTEALTGTIKQINAASRSNLLASNTLIVTFGTAHVYRQVQTRKIVANCHKQAQHLFTKELLTIDAIVNTWQSLMQSIRSFVPNVRFLFSVSPVKYLKDGIHENNLSKATLLLAVQQLTEQATNCFYFPAFELVNDDLRDYRFYKPDMAHPSEQAISYVWQRFTETYFSAETQELCNTLEKIRQAMLHRPLHPESSHSVLFRQKMLEQCILLSERHLFLNLNNEVDFFS